MKNIFFIFLLSFISVTSIAATGEGIGQGYMDEIKVAVEKNGDKIVAIKVIKMDETKRIAQPAIEKLTKDIINSQTVEVDNVAGATFTSLGFKEAVKNALSNAK